jgi:hypothetical protein
VFALGPNHRALICDEGFDSLSGRLRDSVSSVGMVWVMSSMSPLEIWLARYCSTTARHLALTSEFPTPSGWPAASFSLYWVAVVVVSLFRGGPIQERPYPYGNVTLGTCDYNEHRGSQGLALRCRYNKIGIGFVTSANLITYLTNVEGFV